MERPFVEVIDSEVPNNSVLISVGLPGSWKSPVTEEISRRKGFQILRSDMIRLEVLKGEDIFDNRIASDPGRRMRVYEEMFRRAREFLKTSGEGLILDATFVKQDLRVEAAGIAREAGRPFVIVECVCSEEKSIERILKRTKENYESNALTREAYLNNKAIFEPIDLEALKRRLGGLLLLHLTVNTESNEAPDWIITKIDQR
ncbi:MAG: ATP-binding protein [Desulfobacterota bacterium]|nr:ATP-binding protein [Thermodesulfobacteriota bacterium]